MLLFKKTDPSDEKKGIDDTIYTAGEDTIKNKNLTEDASNFWEGDPLLGQSDIKNEGVCSSSLYGGYFCKDDYEDRGSVSESCDPLSGVCEKCFIEDGEAGGVESALRFCITWEFQMSDRGLLSSQWIEKSTSSYIKALESVYKELSSHSSLAPKEQQNQGGMSTHPYDLNIPFSRTIIHFQKKAVDLWTIEAKQSDFTVDAVQEEIRGTSKKTETSYNNDAHITKESLLEGQKETQIRLSLENERINEELRKALAESRSEAQLLYYKNINQNLANLESIISIQFGERVPLFPFKEIKGVENKACSL